MDRLLEWLVKLLFILILAPFVASLAVALVTGVLALVVPWLVLTAAIAGVVAGVSAGLVLRPWSVPRSRAGGLPSGKSTARVDPVKRPRGLRGRKE